MFYFPISGGLCTILLPHLNFFFGINQSDLGAWHPVSSLVDHDFLVIYISGLTCSDPGTRVFLVWSLSHRCLAL